MIAFVLWSICSFGFILFGLYLLCSKKEKPKPFGFWANAEQFPVRDVKGYNRALGKLWCVYGTVLFLLGSCLLAGEGSALVLLCVLGTMLSSIGCMIVYILVIEKKYRK